ncbi:unnamed protein product [Aphanomyces euteiches]
MKPMTADATSSARFWGIENFEELCMEWVHSLELRLVSHISRAFQRMRLTELCNEEDLTGVDILEGISLESWKPDRQSDRCNACVKKFRPWYRRKHHCRVCGEIYCSKCLQYRYVRVPWIGVALTMACTWCCDTSSVVVVEPKTPENQLPKTSLPSMMPVTAAHKRLHKPGPMLLPPRTMPTHGVVTVQFKNTTSIKPLVSPILTARSTHERLNHLCASLCDAMDCGYGAIVLSTPPSIAVVAHKGLTAVMHTDAFRLICTRAMKLGRICCVNQDDQLFQFCGTAPLVAKKDDAIGCLLVLDTAQKTMENPSHVLEHYARIVLDILALSGRIKTTTNVQHKLISIRSSTK